MAKHTFKITHEDGCEIIFPVSKKNNEEFVLFYFLKKEAKNLLDDYKKQNRSDGLKYIFDLRKIIKFYSLNISNDVLNKIRTDWINKLCKSVSSNLIIEFRPQYIIKSLKWFSNN